MVCSGFAEIMIAPTCTDTAQPCHNPYNSTSIDHPHPYAHQYAIPVRYHVPPSSISINHQSWSPITASASTGYSNIFAALIGLLGCKSWESFLWTVVTASRSSLACSSTHIMSTLSFHNILLCPGPDSTGVEWGLWTEEERTSYPSPLFSSPPAPVFLVRRIGSIHMDGRNGLTAPCNYLRAFIQDSKATTNIHPRNI